MLTCRICTVNDNKRGSNRLFSESNSHTTFEGKCNETNMLKYAISVLFERNRLHHVKAR